MEHVMKIRYPMLILAMALSAVAVAHTQLETSVPTDKSRVQAPAAVELRFSEAALLTALTLQKGKDAATTIKPLPATASKHFAVPMPKLAAGDYVVNWRAASDDGHVMSGKFGFTVDPSAPATHAPAQMPMRGGMKMEGQSHMEHMDQMKAGGNSKPEAKPEAKADAAAGQHQH
jgi:methionine-rich copper-binding protein CopC